MIIQTETNKLDGHDSSYHKASCIKLCLFSFDCPETNGDVSTCIAL